MLEKRLFTALFGVIATVGVCGHVRADGSFSDGALQMTCSAECADAYDDDRQKLLRLYYGKNWSRLAAEIITLGYDYDQAYFFLGSAAEGLGNPEAAQKYFRQGRGIAMGILPGVACAEAQDRCNQLDIMGQTGGYQTGLDGSVAANPPAPGVHEDSIICSRADYPDMARKIGQVGRVEVIFEVDPTGKVIDGYADGDEGWPRLEHRAIQLVTRKTWTPSAKSDGPDWRRVRVQFAG